MLNKTKRAFFGILGENIAVQYLINCQYKIVAQNHLIKSDEIDIIALHKEGILVFVEVKTLKNAIDSTRGLMPEDNLTARKYKKLARAAQIFTAKYPNLVDEEKGWRIDLIAIVLDDGDELIDLRHYENI